MLHFSHKTWCKRYKGYFRPGVFLFLFAVYTFNDVHLKDLGVVVRQRYPFKTMINMQLQRSQKASAFICVKRYTFSTPEHLILLHSVTSLSILFSAYEWIAESRNETTMNASLYGQLPLKMITDNAVVVNQKNFIFLQNSSRIHLMVALVSERLLPATTCPAKALAADLHQPICMGLASTPMSALGCAWNSNWDEWREPRMHGHLSGLCKGGKGNSVIEIVCH